MSSETKASRPTKPKHRLENNFAPSSGTSMHNNVTCLPVCTHHTIAAATALVHMAMGVRIRPSLHLPLHCIAPGLEKNEGGGGISYVGIVVFHSE